MTSAFFPSREQNAAPSRCHLASASCARSRLSIPFTGDRLDAAVDSLHEPGEHVARPDLDERRRAAPDELGRRLGEPHRCGQLVDEERGELLGGLHLRRHGRHERRQRLCEPDAVERRAETIRRPRDERAVERPGDLQPDGSSSAEALRLGATLLDGVELAGDDDLPRAVVVRGPHADDPPAELLDLLVGEAEDRRHRARALACRLGHREPALADEADRLGGREHARRGERRELADRVPDDDVGLEAPLAHGGEDGEARRDERRLLDLRLDELLERRLEAQALEVEAGGLGPEAIDLAGGRERLGDVPPIPISRDPLAGEAERDLAHDDGLPFVHSIRAPSPR